MEKTRITVYGAEERCASCVNAPGSKETYEWLQAALGRKFTNHLFEFNYIDILNPPSEGEHVEYTKRILDDEYFYPLIVIDGEVVDEGNPRLKVIYAALADKGIQPSA